MGMKKRKVIIYEIQNYTRNPYVIRRKKQLIKLIQLDYSNKHEKIKQIK